MRWERTCKGSAESAQANAAAFDVELRATERPGDLLIEYQITPGARHLHQ